MKRGIMSTKRYEEVLDLLENDENAFEKLSDSEVIEISRDGYAMTIAAATNINNLQYLSTQLKQDKGYMYNLIKDVNPLAMVYCYKSWFNNKHFVENVRNVALEDAKRYNSHELERLYNDLIDQQVIKAKLIPETKLVQRATKIHKAKNNNMER